MVRPFMNRRKGNRLIHEKVKGLLGSYSMSSTARAIDVMSLQQLTLLAEMCSLDIGVTDAAGEPSPCDIQLCHYVMMVAEKEYEEINKEFSIST